MLDKAHAIDRPRLLHNPCEPRGYVFSVLVLLKRSGPRRVPITRAERHEQVPVLQAADLWPATKTSEALERLGRIDCGRDQNPAKLFVDTGRLGFDDLHFNRRGVVGDDQRNHRSGTRQ